MGLGETARDSWRLHNGSLAYHAKIHVFFFLMKIGKKYTGIISALTCYNHTGTCVSLFQAHVYTNSVYHGEMCRGQVLIPQMLPLS